MVSDVRRGIDRTEAFDPVDELVAAVVDGADVLDVELTVGGIFELIFDVAPQAERIAEISRKDKYFPCLAFGDRSIVLSYPITFAIHFRNFRIYFLYSCFLDEFNRLQPA